MTQMTHRTVAFAQIGLSAAFIIGYFVLLALFMSGEIRTPLEWRDTLQTLLGTLTAGVILILNYWFSRQRQSEDPQ